MRDMTKSRGKIPEWWVREYLAKHQMHKVIVGAIGNHDESHPDYALGHHTTLALAKRIAGGLDALVDSMLRDFDVNIRRPAQAATAAALAEIPHHHDSSPES